MTIAHSLLAKKYEFEERSSSSDVSDDEHPPTKLAKEVSVPHKAYRTTSVNHLPEMVYFKNAISCHLNGCTQISRIHCMDCNVYLCLQSA